MLVLATVILVLILIIIRAHCDCRPSTHTPQSSCTPGPTEPRLFPVFLIICVQCNFNLAAIQFAAPRCAYRRAASRT